MYGISEENSKMQDNYSRIKFESISLTIILHSYQIYCAHHFDFLLSPNYVVFPFKAKHVIVATE